MNLHFNVQGCSKATLTFHVHLIFVLLYKLQISVLELEHIVTCHSD
jgi:hypothetical protein